MKKKVSKKTAPKKAPSKKLASKEDQSSSKISKEDAIKKYRESHKDQLDLELKDPSLMQEEVDNEAEATTEEEIEREEVQVETDGKTEQFAPVDDSQVEEYNPDDEMEGNEEGSYSYGWGYSDSFDDPEEESLASEYGDLDEDELYAKGVKKN